MRKAHLALGTLIATLPLAVASPIARRDSSETRITVAGGTGNYAFVTRGCEGQVIESRKLSFRDAGGALDHKFGNPVRVGVRAGLLEHDIEGRNHTNRYVNPFVSFDWRNVSVGGGYLRAQHGFPTPSGGPGHFDGSAHLRIGDPNRADLTFQMLESVPLYSGGGYGAILFGVRPRPAARFWLGLSTPGPYDAAGVQLGSEFRVAGGLSGIAQARLGSSGDENESAISLGLTQRWAGQGHEVSSYVPPPGTGSYLAMDALGIRADRNGGRLGDTRSPAGVRFVAGYHLDHRWSAEAAVRRFGTDFSATPPPPPPPPFVGTREYLGGRQLDELGGSLSLRGVAPYRQARLHARAGLGLYRGRLAQRLRSTEGIPPGNSVFEYEDEYIDMSPGYEVGIGGTLPLGRHVELGVEAERLWLRHRFATPDDVGVDGGGYFFSARISLRGARD